MRRGLLHTLALVTVLFGAVSPAAEPQNESAPASSADPRWNNLPHTDTEFVPRTYATLADWAERREHLRGQILWSAGLWPMPERTPLNASTSGRIEHADYTVEKVAFESQPGLFVTGNLYRPKKPSPRGHPGVLNPHGHAATGRLHDDSIASYQARGITFARMGCVALIWDMISTFNRTDDAERVHDIIASIGYCRGSGTAGKPPKTVNVVAFGKAGPWLAVAGATLSPPQPGEPEIRFAIDANRFDSSSEQQYLADLFIPGVLRAGGLPNAVALLAPRAVLVQNTGNVLDTSSAVQAFGTSAVPEGRSKLKLESTLQGDLAIHAFLDRPENVRPRP